MTLNKYKLVFFALYRVLSLLNEVIMSDLRSTLSLSFCSDSSPHLPYLLQVEIFKFQLKQEKLRDKIIYQSLKTLKANS